MKRAHLIIPISVVLHLLIINGSLWYFIPTLSQSVEFVVSLNLAWLFIAMALDFYPTRRKERFFTKFDLFLGQCLIFFMAFFSILSFISIYVSLEIKLKFLGILFVNLLFFRWLFYQLRKVYRMEGGNYVNVVVIGRDGNLKKIRDTFDDPTLGYRYKGFFDNKFSKSPTYLGTIQNSFEYIINNEVDEVYCLASQLTNKELKRVINFSDNNLKKIKVVPDNKEIFTRAMNVEQYGRTPVINIRKSPLEIGYARIGKRAFDIVFSGMVILFLLSWLTPLMFILIKLESRGPLFFKQLRHGINKKEFWCYKFRSMAVNKDSDKKMASKNDARITKIGAFIRKTSIDELPQFFNVFLGDMSVVGPRPHMAAHTQEYQSSVDKYLVRHYAKPGITGLAQIKGYRGEIVKPADIINRVRMDIFYLEKWSPLLDIKIILATLTNALEGEEKAY